MGAPRFFFQTPAFTRSCRKQMEKYRNFLDEVENDNIGDWECTVVSFLRMSVRMPVVVLWTSLQNPPENRFLDGLTHCYVPLLPGGASSVLRVSGERSGRPSVKRK